MSFDRFLFTLAGFASILLVAALSVGTAFPPAFARGDDLPTAEVSQGDVALDSDLKCFQNRSAVKYRLSKDLIAGRVRFADAVAQFRALNKDGGPDMTACFPAEPNDTVNMCYARSVASWSENILLFESADKAAFARLSADLHAYLETEMSARSR